MEKILFTVIGYVFYDGSKESLADILIKSGLEVDLGHWALRFPTVDGSFELGYEGNNDKEYPFVVNASGFNFSSLRNISETIGRALKKEGVNFEFTILDEHKEITTINV